MTDSANTSKEHDLQKRARKVLIDLVPFVDHMHPSLADAVIKCAMGYSPDEAATWWYPDTQRTLSNKRFRIQVNSPSRVAYRCLDTISIETSEKFTRYALEFSYTKIIKSAERYTRWLIRKNTNT